MEREEKERKRKRLNLEEKKKGKRREGVRVWARIQREGDRLLFWFKFEYFDPKTFFI